MNQAFSSGHANVKQALRPPVVANYLAHRVLRLKGHGVVSRNWLAFDNHIICERPIRLDRIIADEADAGRRLEGFLEQAPAGQMTVQEWVAEKVARLSRPMTSTHFTHPFRI